MARAVENSDVFSCSPPTVSPGDDLVLRKSSELLDELAVTRPGETIPYFLVVAAAPNEMRPLMSTNAFSIASEVRIDVDSLTGMPWRSGAEQELVFTTRGDYEIRASTALESEEGSYFCKVLFTGRSLGR